MKARARSAFEPRIARGVSSEPAVAALLVHESDRDMARVSIPRPEVQLVVRFGPSARAGVDAHAMGVTQSVARKVIRRGQRTVIARLHLGASEAVLGVNAPALAGRIVALEELWGATETQRLYDRLAAARDTLSAAKVRESAISERRVRAHEPRPSAQLALDAALRLRAANNG